MNEKSVAKVVRQVRWATVKTKVTGNVATSWVAQPSSVTCDMQSDFDLPKLEGQKQKHFFSTCFYLSMAQPVCVSQQ